HTHSYTHTQRYPVQLSTTHSHTQRYPVQLSTTHSYTHKGTQFNSLPHTLISAAITTCQKAEHFILQQKNKGKINPFKLTENTYTHLRWTSFVFFAFLCRTHT